MNYLIYIELAAENLQFFLWFRDYLKRFQELPDKEKALSPEWIPERNEFEKDRPAKKISPDAAAIFKGSDFANGPQVSVKEYNGANPFSDSANSDRESTFPGSESGWDEKSTLQSSHGRADYHRKAVETFQAAGIKYQPCEHQAILTSLKRHC